MDRSKKRQRVYVVLLSAKIEAQERRHKGTIHKNGTTIVTNNVQLLAHINS